MKSKRTHSCISFGSLKVINPSFKQLEFNGRTAWELDDTSVYGLSGDNMLNMKYGGSWFIFVYEGRVLVNGAYMLTTGMYACVSGGNLYALDATRALTASTDGR